ncbi:mevalonate kinase [Lactobacillus corticis]|uniref:Mevalonate kinase n=1 Tax=Lactobacillus corticis TaxID=2201249 RepID=A0A916VHU2_9LACO|nr:mevalonate kinase [Lactobacillus corticis]GFZ27032.1 mevalonate kinase [Lactobacillus corticis]
MQAAFKAHGKVIIIGEHSVVYGYDAIAIPVKNLAITTQVSPAKDEHWMDTARYHGPFFAAPSNYDGLKYVVRTLLDKVNYTGKIHLTYTGEIPMERGFGSSATVALGTTKALSEFLKLDLTQAEIMAITNHAEMINHGKASGLDAATVNSDYPVFFNKQDGPKPLPARLGAPLLIMDTGILGNTKEAVGLVKNELAKDAANSQKLARLGELADLTKKAWLAHDPQLAGKIFTEAQAILRAFKLSIPQIDQLEQIALKAGAYGFKLSGGGLGGIVICLCQSHQQAEQIASDSQHLISNYWIEDI